MGEQHPLQSNDLLERVARGLQTHHVNASSMRGIQVADELIKRFHGHPFHREINIRIGPQPAFAGDRAKKNDAPGPVQLDQPRRHFFGFAPGGFKRGPLVGGQRLVEVAPQPRAVSGHLFGGDGIHGHVLIIALP